ncbi:sulfur carrier protein ThiS [Danxiaibacter flavus]|uniref:Sulfur carrier protein ThiS n=1 Tax=Danxiaibacter flavus TaxID=3049108 RepID=A0ABV3ZM16_9BACT|nr:sulfur carrier protein ThiS [Chitinophagaceae bacterium DXS]
MNILLNSKPQEIADHLTLSLALQALQINSLNGVAIAVNNIVIPKKDWESYILEHNDALVIIKASQGG